MSSSLNDITDQIALVTGSTKGIGRAIAERLTADGARVIVHGRSFDTVEQVREEIGAFGAIAADVSTAEGVEALLAAVETYGEVDILVNNTGVFEVKDVFDVSDAEWQGYFDVNVMSVVRLTRALLKPMLERGRGQIVNVGSEAGVKPLAQMIPYSVTKGALQTLTRGLAEVTKGTAVNVNTLLPGPTWTEGVASYFEGLAEDEGRELDDVIGTYFQTHEPTSLSQRFGTVEEVADGAAFLIGNPAVNGSALRVEGGIIRSI